MAEKALLTATKGIRLQRHLDALYSTPKHFHDGNKQRTKISTGLTIQYAVHSCDLPGATEDEHIVLIMGLRQRMEWWAPTVDVLLSTWKMSGAAKNLKIATFDNRGIGGSDEYLGRYTTSQMAADTLALLDHLGWEKAHVGGFSMGGMIAQEMALLAPSRLKSLTLLSTTRGRFVAIPEIETPLYLTMGLATHPDTVASGALWIMHSEEFMARKMEDRDTTVRDELHEYYKHRLLSLGQPYAVGTLSQMLAVATHHVSDSRLAAIGEAGFPVLIMGGCRDRFIPYTESKKLAERIPGDHVRLVIFEDGGHSIVVEYLDEIAHELLSMVQCASS